MQFLAEILFDLLTSLVPWFGRGDDSRSVVGESDLDRSARRLWIWTLGVLLSVAFAIGLWLHFRG